MKNKKCIRIAKEPGKFFEESTSTRRPRSEITKGGARKSRPKRHREKERSYDLVEKLMSLFGVEM